MPLESLLELVETLRARIDVHGTSLRQNEMRTRYSLIDPLLRELGWDTSNPSEVMIEDGSGEGRADYALQVDGRTSMIIEAKRLGLGVSDGRRQAINYAMDPRRTARYFGVTDGNQWEIYDTHQPAINMLVVSFAVRGDTVAEACLKALSLWKHGIAEDTVVAGEAPFLGLKLESQEISRPNAGPGSQLANMTQSPTATSDSPSVRIADATSRNEKVWIPLSELQPKLRSPPPVEILFPDGSSTRLGRWNLIMVESVRWLLANNFLSRGQFPIQQGKRYLIADNPVHSTGTRFHQAKQVGEYFLEASYNADYQVRNANKVINLAGQDPSKFKVRLP